MSTRKETAEKVLRSLRLNLVLSMVLPLMLFSGVAIYAGLTAVEENFNDRLREDLELVSRAVSGPLSGAMSQGDELVLGESLKSLFRIGRVYGASVFDSEGKQVASLGVADSDVAGSESAGKAIASGELGGAFRRVDGVAVFSQFTPLIAEDGRIQGLLQITRKRSDFHDRGADGGARPLRCSWPACESTVGSHGRYGARALGSSRVIFWSCRNPQDP